MSRRVVNWFLLLAFFGSVGLHVFADRDLTRRNVEVVPEMAYSPAYDSFAPNPNFADGKTLQLPEPGTIPRGRLPLHYGPSLQDFLRAGDELHNPFAGDDAAARGRGAFVYANYCQMCHGPAGKGDGPLVPRGLPPPASLVAEKPVPLKDGEMFHIITYGQRNMPSHAAQLSREDRWKVILHVRSLQQKAAGEKRP
ncbi:MAG TPA: cytochrome c [Gemmataceae bacterium]|nr:cytochrome c [Gemmataceae bacterium]